MKTYLQYIGRKFAIKIFALKNFKINIHQNVSRAFNILYYNNCLKCTKTNILLREKESYMAKVGKQDTWEKYYQLNNMKNEIK